MKKIFFLLIAIVLVLNAKVTNDSFEYKDETLRLRISKNSINRVVLPAEITGKLYSKEKDLSITINGNEAYLKVIPKKKTEFADNKIVESEIVYSSNEVEIFFLTDKKTYSVIFIPDNIDPRTVYITDKSLIKEDITKIEKGSTEYTTNIKNIFRLAIENKLNSFKEIKKNETHDNLLFLSRYDGVNFQVYKFFIKNKESQTIDGADEIVKNKIVASAIFENNYFVLTEKGSEDARQE